MNYDLGLITTVFSIVVYFIRVDCNEGCLRRVEPLGTWKIGLVIEKSWIWKLTLFIKLMKFVNVSLLIFTLGIGVSFFI